MEQNMPVQSGSPRLAARAKAIVMTPKTEWPLVAQERTQPRQVLLGYAMPLAAIGPLAGLIGGQLFGIGVLGFRYHPSLVSGISSAIVAYVMALVSLFVVAFAANYLSPKFGGREDFPAAFRLVAYSMTAAWLAGIFSLILSLAIIGLILSLYSFYLFYLGATAVMGVPREKATGYTAVTVVVVLVIYLVASALIGAMSTATGVGAGATLAQNDRGTIDLGELGKVSVDGNTTTITANGHSTTVKADGKKASLTSDGETVNVDVPDQD